MVNFGNDIGDYLDGIAGEKGLAPSPPPANGDDEMELMNRQQKQACANSLKQMHELDLFGLAYQALAIIATRNGMKRMGEQPIDENYGNCLRQWMITTLSDDRFPCVTKPG